MILSIIILMYLSILSVAFFKLFHDELTKETINVNNIDMYSKDNYEEVLCEVNNFSYKVIQNINDFKGRNTNINRNVILGYDNSTCKFFVSYKYKGITYQYNLKIYNHDEKVLFLPEEKKYIND